MFKYYPIPFRQSICIVFYCLCSYCTSIGAAEIDADIEMRYGRFLHRHPVKTEIDQGVSKLKWREVLIIDASFHVQRCWKKKGYFRCQLNVGSVVKAEVKDADYLYDAVAARKMFSLSHATSGDGEHIICTLGIGRYYHPFSCSLLFVPLVGLSFRQLGFTMVDGHQDFYLYKDRSIEFINNQLKELCSSYQSRWYAPWVGFDLSWDRWDRLAMKGKVEIHFPVHQGRGFWNLRDDYWKEGTLGLGVVIELSSFYRFSSCYNLGIKFGYENLATYGRRETYIFDPPAGSTELESGEEIAVPSKRHRCLLENFVLGVVLSKTF